MPAKGTETNSQLLTLLNELQSERRNELSKYRSLEREIKKVLVKQEAVIKSAEAANVTNSPQGTSSSNEFTTSSSSSSMFEHISMMGKTGGLVAKTNTTNLNLEALNQLKISKEKEKTSKMLVAGAQPIPNKLTTNTGNSSDPIKTGSCSHCDCHKNTSNSNSEKGSGNNNTTSGNISSEKSAPGTGNSATGGASNNGTGGSGSSSGIQIEGTGSSDQSGTTKDGIASNGSNGSGSEKDKQVTTSHKTKMEDRSPVVPAKKRKKQISQCLSEETSEEKLQTETTLKIKHKEPKSSKKERHLAKKVNLTITKNITDDVKEISSPQ